MQKTALQSDPLAILDDFRMKSLLCDVLKFRLDRSVYPHFGIALGKEEARKSKKELGLLAGGLVDCLLEFRAVSKADLRDTRRIIWECCGMQGERYHNFEEDARRSNLRSFFRAFQKVRAEREKTYLGIATEADIEYRERKFLLRDVALLEDQLLGGTCVDLGCGTNSLGMALLEHSDLNRKMNPIMTVMGVDVYDWRLSGNRKRKYANDRRLRFVKQGKSCERLDILGESVDMVIVKWALHHMTSDCMSRQVAHIRRILRPKGRLIVFEALLSNNREILKVFERPNSVLKDSIAWPEGPWCKERLEFTKLYLHLPTDKQRSLLLFEDFYGHVLVNDRDFISFTSNYMTVKALRSLFEDAGLVSLKNEDRVFGMSPLIRPGPPSVRLVFEKP